MSTDGFDQSATGYGDMVQDSISFSGQDHEYFIRRKVDALVSLSSRLMGPISEMTFLDVGCGVGTMAAALEKRVGQLFACDPSTVSAPRAASSTTAAFASAGEWLSVATGAVDIAYTVNVLHHVEPESRDALVAEMARVVRPGGLVVAFEHNPFNPLTRLSVARCEFDEGVILLRSRELRQRMVRAGLRELEHRYILFTPFDVAWQHRLESRLGRIPMGAQHYVVAQR